jgi:predicted RNA polymerase sigma factor
LRSFDRHKARTGHKSQEGKLASGEVKLASGFDQILPSAKDFMKKLALTEMEEAAKQALKDKQAAAEKQALLDQLKAPSGVGDEEAVRRGVKLIERAVSNGLTEVQVYRFPNALCTDHGRAINQQEPGWEKTLTGVPKEIYLLWERHFKARGYKLRVEIVNFPGGMPGDVGMTLKWS